MDEIALTVPADRAWRPLAQLVLSGLGARIELTLEALDELQLAVAELLDRSTGDDVEVLFRVDSGQLEAKIGPLRSGLVAEMEGNDQGVGLNRLLSTLTDGVEVDEINGTAWVTLRKGVPAAASSDV
jgi:hypothetical protein